MFFPAQHTDYFGFPKGSLHVNKPIPRVFMTFRLFCVTRKNDILSIDIFLFCEGKVQEEIGNTFL